MNIVDFGSMGGSYLGTKKLGGNAIGRRRYSELIGESIEYDWREMIYAVGRNSTPRLRGISGGGGRGRRWRCCLFLRNRAKE